MRNASSLPGLTVEARTPRSPGTTQAHAYRFSKPGSHGHSASPSSDNTTPSGRRAGYFGTLEAVVFPSNSQRTATGTSLWAVGGGLAGADTVGKRGSPVAVERTHPYGVGTGGCGQGLKVTGGLFGRGRLVLLDIFMRGNVRPGIAYPYLRGFYPSWSVYRGHGPPLQMIQSNSLTLKTL